MLAKIIVLSLIFSIILLYLKNTASDYFIPVLILSSVVILSLVLSYVLEFFTLFEKIKSLTGISQEIFTLIFKIVAIFIINYVKYKS